MAVKIRVKSNGDQEGKNKQPSESTKPTVKVRVKKEEPKGSSIPMDPNIKGPIGFLNSYYDSPEFSKRYQERNFQPFDKSGMLLAMKYYKPMIGSSEDGSHATSLQDIRGWPRLNAKPGEYPTIMLDTAQANKLKLNLIHDVLPHEYTHTTRGLNFAEEKDFVDKNKVKVATKKYPYDKWLKSPEFGEEISAGNTENIYSTYLGEKGQQTGILTHDEQPQESYADLNALRYMLYKQGIYDTRKGPMTMDHFQKAMKDPWLKEQFTFKRMLKHFKPEDIIKLNNTIAMNNNKTTNNNNA